MFYRNHPICAQARPKQRKFLCNATKMMLPFCIQSRYTIGASLIGYDSANCMSKGPIGVFMRSKSKRTRVNTFGYGRHFIVRTGEYVRSWECECVTVCVCACVCARASDVTCILPLTSRVSEALLRHNSHIDIIAPLWRPGLNCLFVSVLFSCYRQKETYYCLRLMVWLIHQPSLWAVVL